MNHTHEVTSQLRAAARLQRLTCLYALLSELKTAIAPCRYEAELLATVFSRMSRSNLFPMLFVAQPDDARVAMHLTHSHGIPFERVQELETVLADPAGFLSKALNSMEERHTMRLCLTDQGIDHSLAGWLRAEGLSDLILMPLHAEGSLIGVVGLHVTGPDVFDADHLEAMDHITTDVCIALDNIIAGRRREAAELAARTSETRFHEVFESSPMPMLVYSKARKRMTAINRSMQVWLGYDLEDIAAVDDWLERFFPDPDIREHLRKVWNLNHVAPGSGDVAMSPELTISAKDGSRRIATATVTRLGDEMIIAFNDLTEIRRQEKASVESGEMFRKMIEQSAVGIYVRRAGHFVYANPRYAEIIGYPREEVEGLDIHRVTTADPGNLNRIHAAWQRLEDGAPTVTYRVPVIRKDGRIIELELHARRIDWEGQPADIVVVDDITERKEQEDRIAVYLRQLEGSMKSTLTAISHMVEMRDPYTAGHERRTGLIASAIAREMGWSEERCAALEMIGLVHDIGKIAVPAEILTKPGVLSDIEFRIVKEHAQAGYDILKDIPFPSPVADVIWQHHEHLDGSGYPRGLRGDQILPEARVLAVADLLESMASHRPYRPALGMEAAIDELKKYRGVMFDPEVVDTVVGMVEKKDYRLPT